MPFPINPSVGDTYVENNTTYEYLGPVNGWYRKEVDTNNDTTYIGSDGAPGGVSNNTEVIFNDSGSLASDSGLTYDKATGDLTVSGTLTAGSLSGPSSFSLGSAALPSVYFGADTNTGLYSPGADQVAISTNGTGRLFVDSSGKVTAGNIIADAPNNRVSINSGTVDTPLRVMSGTNNDTTIVRISGNQTANGFTVGTYFSDATNDGGVRLAASKSFAFDANGSERLRITSDGKVGLGTSSPSAELHLNDATGVSRIRFTGGAGGADSFEIGQAVTGVSNSGFSIFDVEATATRFVIDSLGNVGIGTASPSEALSVVGASGTNLVASVTSQVSTGSYLGFFDTATTDRPMIGALGNNFAFRTNGVERARIDSSGHLLVGTSSSIGGADLQVASTLGNLLEISRFQAGNAGPYINTYKSRGATVGTNAAVVAGDFLGGIQFSGAEGSGYRPAANIRAFVESGTISSTSMPGRLVFSTTADGAASPTERMRIKNDGTINFSNVAVYADNAAATSGGLAVGDVYRTSTGQLMIRY